MVRIREITKRLTMYDVILTPIITTKNNAVTIRYRNARDPDLGNAIDLLSVLLT
jgi:hypothetical protein